MLKVCIVQFEMMWVEKVAEVSCYCSRTVAIEGYLPLNFVVVFSSIFFRFLTTEKLIGDFLHNRQCAANCSLNFPF